ncbi:MAG: RNA-directed DNA polymerase [Cyanobacteriota bacterium]|nr:RNA-directed DNA polymerase [Cyanobacteriota bacterium]
MTNRKLNEQSIKWSLDHLLKYGDTDLFPKQPEFEVLQEIREKTVRTLKDIDLGNYNYGTSRRFIVPKDEFSYRIATQLDPLDSIVLTSIIHEYGHQIESRRIPIEDCKVFGYRFAPQNDFNFYDRNVSWLNFWHQCQEKSFNYKYIVYLDIADFYNQIYHHTIDNQLIESQFPNQIKKWIMGLIENITAKVSRGIPIGPHSTHLLAEMSLIPFDNSLCIKGIDYCRYVDDIIIFCNEYEEARIIIYEIASILDKQQRLILQRQKTKIYQAKDFKKYCEKMLQDRPINNYEKDILNFLTNFTNQDPYTKIDLGDFRIEDNIVFQKNRVEKVLSAYLKNKEPNFTRLRWFLRRLSQVGVSSAVDFCLKNVNELTPAISDICNYLVSVNIKYREDWKSLGLQIFELLKSNIVKSNEYFQMTLLSLFHQKPDLNNTRQLISIYSSSPSSIKREILLSIQSLNMGDWLRELKESYDGLDTWSKRAFLLATKSLPSEERKFFLNQVKEKTNDALDKLLIEWAKL